MEAHSITAETADDYLTFLERKLQRGADHGFEPVFMPAKLFDFRPTLSDIQRQAHATAVDKGWYDGDRPPLELLMLIVTEVAECAEEWRRPETEPFAIAEELADIVIRCADAAAYWQIDLETAVLAKMERNASRPHRHGGKRY